MIPIQAKVGIFLLAITSIYGAGFYAGKSGESASCLADKVELDNELDEAATDLIMAEATEAKIVEVEKVVIETVYKDRFKEVLVYVESDAGSTECFNADELCFINGKCTSLPINEDAGEPVSTPTANF